MELKDLVITPVYLLLIYLLAYMVRPLVTDRLTRKFFIPALTVRIIGAIAVGFIYQFYYKGGDTYNYYYHGSHWVWEAFLDSPVKAFKLILANGKYEGDTFQYASRIYFYTDLPSYFVVRIAGLFSLLAFDTYSTVACFFAVLSFSGVWVLYLTFYRVCPGLYKEFAWAVLFIPSVFFWGSGLLKDTLTIAALGWATFSIYRVVFEKRQVLLLSITFLLSCYVLYSIKIYILLCFLPPLIIWVFTGYLKKIRNVVLRFLLAPFIFLVAGGLGYYALVEIGEESARYNLQNVSYTAEETAKWLTYVGELQGGSVYTLGDFDYSPAGIIRKIPLAINVTLFRPYLWESHNVVMLISALESLLTLLLTIYVLWKIGLGRTIQVVRQRPVVLFCFIFSIAFAFSVGIATYNFGSLVRYKIPLLPFYFAGLALLYFYAKRDKKLPVLATTE